jgi:hypothetical protein
MKNSFKLLMILATLAVGTQSFAMSRFFNAMRTKVAFRTTALRSSCKQAFAPFKINFSRSLVAQRWNNSAFSRFTAPKQTSNCSALAGTFGLTAAGMALYNKPARAEGAKPEAAAPQTKQEKATQVQYEDPFAVVHKGYFDVCLRFEKELARTQILIEAKKREAEQYKTHEETLVSLHEGLESKNDCKNYSQFIEGELLTIWNKVEEIEKQIAVLEKNQKTLEEGLAHAKSKVVVG